MIREAGMTFITICIIRLWLFSMTMLMMTGKMPFFSGCCFFFACYFSLKEKKDRMILVVR